MALLTQTYTTTMGSQPLELPISSINAQQAIALLMVIEQPLTVIMHAGRDLAALSHIAG